MILHRIRVLVAPAKLSLKDSVVDWLSDMDSNHE